MSDIEGIKKRVDDAEHYTTCPKARNECKRCDDWFYSATNVQAIIRTLVIDIKAVIESRDIIIRERNTFLEERDDARRGLNETLAELDELRTRHARIIDSTESFVAALVDERFKKDHASMLAELESLRAKDIESSKRMRIDIDAMPSDIRSIFESARVDAKAKDTTILRALVDMVANSRHERNVERLHNAKQAAMITNLRDECRKHLARINVLESNAAAIGPVLDHAAKAIDLLVKARVGNPGEFIDECVSRLLLNWAPSVGPVPLMLHCPMCHHRHIDTGEYATKPHHTHACQQCGTVWRPAIVATVGVQFLPGFKDAQPSHVLDKVQGDGECAHIGNRGSTLPVNESTAHDTAKVEDKSNDASSANVVPDDVLRRAADWAIRNTHSGPLLPNIDAARRVINGDSIVSVAWSLLVREFVKLWRNGCAPDRPNVP